MLESLAMAVQNEKEQNIWADGKHQREYKQKQ
jgi:hypothetical protein